MSAGAPPGAASTLLLRALGALALPAIVVAACAVRPAPELPLVPAGVPHLSREAWGAQPPVLPMRAHLPVRLTIHHTGVAQDTGRSTADKLIGLQRFSQRDDSLASGRLKPAWADVPYHFYVGLDGVVGEARDWRYAGDTNTEYDPAGHLLVVVEGNFQRDTLTAAQRRSLDLLIPSLAHRFGIPADSLASHRDYASTSCPGEHLYVELPRLRERIGAAR